MNQVINYTPCGKYRIISNKLDDETWETSLYKYDSEEPITKYVNKNFDAAYAIHYKLLWDYSGTAHPEDVLGIGEGYY